MTENMNVAERRQAATRISQSAQRGTRIHKPPTKPMRYNPAAVAANQAPWAKPLYLGGATLET